MKQLFGFLFLITFTASAQHFTKITTGPQSNDGGDSRSVNWVDYDNDGDLDLFITNGPSATANNFLYKNNGNGTFTKITDASIVNDPGSYDGSTWADYDNDGFVDAYSATWYGQKNSLHRQLNGKFQKIIRGEIGNDQTFSETASWGDYDNDGYVDLYLANSSGNKANNLYKNNRDGTFSKITSGAIVTDAVSSRSVDWCDLDNDGDLDLFVANEGGANESLYWNNGNGTFTAETSGAIVNDGGVSFGSSVADIDNDGDFDVLVVNHGNQNESIYLNNGNKTFTKVTSGVVVGSGGYSVGSAFGDLDNDGDLDLMVTNAFAGTAQAKNFLYLNNGDGSFVKVDTGIVSTSLGWSYGVAFGDYDRDGDLDIATANCFSANQNNSLYRNEGNGNNWLTVKAIGRVSNFSAIGARVKVKATVNGKTFWQVRQVAGQSGYCGQNLESHFGLGNATVIDSLIVEFPSGQKTIRTNVSTNQLLTITESTPLGFLRSAFVADSIQGRIPFTVQFKNISVVDSAKPVTSWQWDFNNDGVIDATTKDAQWTYTNPDTYSVMLRISNGTEADTLSAKNLIYIWKPISAPMLKSYFPAASDTTIPKNGKVNFEVSVLDTSDSPVTYVWSRNNTVQSSVTNKYTYTSLTLLAAPRTDTFKVVISNDFISIQKVWLVHVLNVINSVKDDPLIPKNKLSQNYPNPFNPATMIDFELKSDADVVLKLYDSIGREVQTLVRGKFSQGRHTVELNAEDLSSGTYYYKIFTDSFTDVKKIVLMK